MTDPMLDVFFHPDVLSMRVPDGLFEKPASPLLAHQMPFAEGPERIANIRAVLERAPSAHRFRWHEGRPATDAEITRFHTPEYLRMLEDADATGRWLTDTTCLPAGGMRAVRAGAGTVLAASEAILTGQTRMAYALVRPPGHHAARDVADGYCFLNGVAMAAERARAAGCARVAVVDWDVHHGNGTQAGFYARDDVLTISVHMNHGPWSPDSHPQTGEVDETGTGAGLGYNLNLPLPFGSGDAATVALIRQIVLPALRRFAPNLIIVANGQDASQFDPNGRQLLSMAGFHAMAALLAEVADATAHGLLIAQEGGYNPAYTGFCAYATALGFLRAPLDLPDPLAYYPEDAAAAAQAVAALIARHPLLDEGGQWRPEGA